MLSLLALSLSLNLKYHLTPTQLACFAGVVQLLSTGQLQSDFWDWDYSAGFSWGPDAGEEEAPAVQSQPGWSHHTFC